MSAPNDIVLYHYPASPFAKRVFDYLTLRGISYSQCLQPPILPREDLNSLGIQYRRIPILAIGRDVYCDTRLIIRKLEEKFPDGKLGAPEKDQRAIERLLERWTIDAGVFFRATQLLPPELPFLKDPNFQKDRGELMPGRDWSAEGQAKRRPEAIAHMRDCFELLETTLLADGRKWILKTDKPTLADLEAVWPLNWMANTKGAIPETSVSKSLFPNVYAWIERFNAAVKEAKSKASKPVTLKGPEAAKHVISAALNEQGGEIDPNDPLGLKEGAEVVVSPNDYGTSHRDQGRLVTLTPHEIAIEVQTKTEGKTIILHFPRWGFRCAEKAAGGAKL